MTSAAPTFDDLPGALRGPIGLCLDCGYSLRGLPTPRCPECGREFDPLDPKTMNMGRELSALAKWVLGPIRWPLSFLTWGAIAFSLWSARLPGGQFASSRSLVILIALGMVWLIWPLVRILAAHRYGWPTSLLLRGQRQRILVGVMIAACAVAILYRLPERDALAISRPAMQRLADELIASPTPYLPDRRVGLFMATRIRQIPGGMRFTVEEHNRAYRAGYAYMPKQDPKRLGSRRVYRYLGNGWFAWREEG